MAAKVLVAITLLLLTFLRTKLKAPDETPVVELIVQDTRVVFPVVEGGTGGVQATSICSVVVSV